MNATDDIQVDRLIQDEVGKLLQDGNTYEAKLYQLDKKLEESIALIRSQKMSYHKSSTKPSNTNSRQVSAAPS